ncbi:unnamed protein product [Allacma fusca]|uniref:Uncharacterized protein n=1 Tax=Allacma fusca TaxID=39272 RepID=A0A8J2KSK0_9HEXA|nr:unnamed protein product [Allacma fusca]
MRKSMIFVIVFVVVVFIWAVWITQMVRKKSSGGSGRKVIGKAGAIFDLEKDPSEFVIEGFEYHRKFPLTNKHLRSSDMWLLTGRVGKGTISLKGLQQKRRKVRDVVMVVKYHVFWEGAAFLTAIGTEMKTNEQVMETLPQGGESYCSRLVFMGPVDEVQLEAVARDKKSFVVIDEFKVAVGSKVFDKLEEVVCL